MFPRLRTGFRRWQGLVVLAVLLTPQQSPAAAYVKLPTIEGESTDSKHKDWINLLSVTSAVVGPEVDGEPGSTRFREMKVWKELDKASPLLAQACATGEPLNGVELDFTRSTESGQVTYYKYKLENVVISSYQLGSAGGGGLPMDTVSLNFTRAEWYYWQLGPGGSRDYHVNAYWDLLLQKGDSAGGPGEGTGNTAPGIDPIAAQSVQPGERRELKVTISDAETPAGDLVLTAATDRPDLVTSIELSGTGGTRTLSFTVTSLYSGFASLSVEVSDGESASSTAFTVLIDVEMTAWEAFIAAYFTPEEQLDADLVSPLGDPDSDDLDTAIEFALGTNPREYTWPQEAVRVRRENTPGGPVIRLQFRRLKDAGKLGPTPWMAPESLLFEPLGPGNPLYEESTSEASNPLYEDVEGTIHVDPDGPDVHFIRMHVIVD